MPDLSEEALRVVNELAQSQFRRMQLPEQEVAMLSLMNASEDEILAFLERHYAERRDKA